MTTLDWIITFAVFFAATQMKDLFRFQAFADELRKRRPKPHTFG